MTGKIDNYHYFFAAGTGILPFMDFFDLVLKYSMYKALKKKFD